MKKRKLVAILAVMLALAMLCSTALARGKGKHGHKDHHQYPKNTSSETPEDTSSGDDGGGNGSDDGNVSGDNGDNDGTISDNSVDEAGAGAASGNDGRHGHGSNNHKGDKHHGKEDGKCDKHHSHKHEHCKPDNKPSLPDCYSGTLIVQIMPPAQCIPILPPRTGGASLGLLYGAMSLIGLAGAISIRARKRQV
ncbi:MAG TPA: hypothetical protein PLH38_03835 [Clostridia bacterium]|nr:hypothetical protein [Clostridia bacterium]